MRLFRRGRDNWAAATVLSVRTTPRFDKHCEVEVHPVLSRPFVSTLRTHAEMVEGAETFVRYDPAHPEECELDRDRLPPGHAYTFTSEIAQRGHVTLADAAERLAALDTLTERHRRGELSEAEWVAERDRVLSRPAR